jgi:hypothetical protein
MHVIFLTEKDCKEIKSMKSGNEYDFIIHAKYQSKNKFQVMSVDCPNEGKQLNEDDFSAKNIKRLEQRANE